MSDVILYCLCLWSLSGHFAYQEKEFEDIFTGNKKERLNVFGTEFMQVKEGDCVTLPVNLTEHQRKQGISWKFGDRGFLIAEITRGNGKVKTYEDQAEGRFRDRLMLDQTGSLTITNITNTHSGLYEVSNTSTNAKLKTFNVIVYAHLPVPVITNSSSLEGSSSSKCLLLCSVMDVSHVSLSWYKRKSLLSSISVFEPIISISLHLECLDDSYTCVVNNSITNQTQHLTAEVCHKCSGFCSCGFTEAAIRLVLSALVGVAVVAVMVSDIRYRKNGQKKGSDQKKMVSDQKKKTEEDGIRPEEDGIRTEEDGIRTEEDGISPEEIGIRHSVN